MLENIVAGLAHHDATCPMPPRAILLNPSDHAEFDWDEIKGVPVEASDSVTPKRFRIDCSGSAHGIEKGVRLAQQLVSIDCQDPIKPGELTGSGEPEPQFIVHCVMERLVNQRPVDR